jgi:hypothetical protein
LIIGGGEEAPLALPPEKWDVVSAIIMAVIVVVGLALAFWYGYWPTVTP